jgi:hypothetical protein
MRDLVCVGLGALVSALVVRYLRQTGDAAFQSWWGGLGVVSLVVFLLVTVVAALSFAIFAR